MDVCRKISKCFLKATIHLIGGVRYFWLQITSYLELLPCLVSYTIYFNPDSRVKKIHLTLCSKNKIFKNAPKQNKNLKQNHKIQSSLLFSRPTMLKVIAIAKHTRKDRLWACQPTGSLVSPVGRDRVLRDSLYGKGQMQLSWAMVWMWNGPTDSHSGTLAPSDLVQGKS